MVDAREQIKDLLESIEYEKPFRVKMTFPQSVNDGILITYNEVLNNQTAVSVVDEIAFLVDIWALDMVTMVDLSCLVSDKLTGIGLKRQFTSPDSSPEENGGYFRKTMRFGRKVDTRTNRLID